MQVKTTEELRKSSMKELREEMAEALQEREKAAKSRIVKDRDEKVGALDKYIKKVDSLIDAAYEKGCDSEHACLKVVRGQRYDPVTGEEVSVPYVQIFTYPEAVLFSKNREKLGVRVLKVIHNPFTNIKFE